MMDRERADDLVRDVIERCTPEEKDAFRVLLVDVGKGRRALEAMREAEERYTWARDVAEKLGMDA